MKAKIVYHRSVNKNYFGTRLSVSFLIYQFISQRLILIIVRQCKKAKLKTHSKSRSIWSWHSNSIYKPFVPVLYQLQACWRCTLYRSLMVINEDMKHIPVISPCRYSASDWPPARPSGSKGQLSFTVKIYSELFFWKMHTINILLFKQLS